jgi:hypothetical protein
MVLIETCSQVVYKLTPLEPRSEGPKKQMNFVLQNKIEKSKTKGAKKKQHNFFRSKGLFFSIGMVLRY